MVTTFLAAIRGPSNEQRNDRADNVRRGGEDQSDGSVTELEALDDGRKEVVESIRRMVCQKHESLVKDKC